MQPMAPGRPPALVRNPLSLTGVAIALVSLANIVFLVLAMLLAERPSPYLGIFAYVVLPLIMLLGLLLVPIGIFLERRRRRRHPERPLRLPTIDFNRPSHRRALGLALIALVLAIVVSAAASYQAFEYTESVGFCGELCHTPMRPELASYQVSPHARVACVECHVGEGAGSYVKAKLSGVRQVALVLADRFPRPIHAEESQLEPARETCERCHWPDKYWGNQLRVFTRFAADEANTPRQLRMLVRVGGGNPDVGPVGGIHWHMNLQHEITFIASDPQRQEIPWVRAKAADGTVTEYLASGAQLTPEQIAAAPKRRMDCMDCHNRPSHVFRPPDDAVNEALAAGRIDRTLPFVKQQAVEALTKEYASTPEARDAIAQALSSFYEQQQPKVYAAKREAVARAIAETQRIYETSIFPEMKSSWQTHPNNIGHLTSPGCFRCHDGQHTSADGKTIRNECEVCHVVVEQREGSRALAALTGAPFRHPVDIGDLTAAPCSSCHTGGTGP